MALDEADVEHGAKEVDGPYHLNVCNGALLKPYGGHLDDRHAQSLLVSRCATTVLH